MLSASSATAAAHAAPTVRSLLSVTRSQNFSEWYRTVIKEADLAEHSAVRGCMVIKSWGYGIWEQIQRQLDDTFKREKCCKNYYFPLFIPVEFFEQEATHVEGFAQECAVVTHYRMTTIFEDGKMKMIPDPDSKLGRPLIVRPTSETIIGDSFNKWVHSYRDLPIEVNQWANVVRWENETRPFLRTTEFLWQEGHCAYANEREARANTLKMAQVYNSFMTRVCALPVILGEKSPGERFAGAVQTLCLEGMMQDGKAVQAGTSHYLGQNFAKASNITFTDQNGESQFVHTTSWGVSTRLIGALIMTHGDDDGLRIPPRLALHHVVIIPSGKKTEERAAYIETLENLFKEKIYAGREISVEVDKGEANAGEKKWDWVRKGVPIRLEVGPREAKSQTVTVFRRDQPHEQKATVAFDELVNHVIGTLGEIQQNYFEQAVAYRDRMMHNHITNFEELKDFFENPENKGFVRVKWSGNEDTERMLKELKLTIRCIPNEQSGTEGVCFHTGQPASQDVIIGKSY